MQIVQRVQAAANGDPSFDERREPLQSFFKPRSVAVIGATDHQGSVGGALLWNLIRSPFDGTIYPVNPKRPTVLGIKCYPRIADVPARVNLAVVATPAAAVPAVIGECVDAGVSAAIIISAGFKEIGPEGAALEQQILEQAQRGRMRIIGPNCLGVMSPLTGLNATFANAMARPGTVGFISQSGALCTAILDWSLAGNGRLQRVRFGRLHARRRLGRPDRLPGRRSADTHSIVIYMESIGDARGVPLGRARSGADQADHRDQAGPHRGRGQSRRIAHRRAHRQRRSAGRRVPPLRRAARRQHRRPVLSWPKCWPNSRARSGPRLTIVTNAGGPGVLATDALIMGGGQLAELTQQTIDRLNRRPAPALEPSQSHRYLGRRRRRTLRQSRGMRLQGSQQQMACW